MSRDYELIQAVKENDTAGALTLMSHSFDPMIRDNEKDETLMIMAARHLNLTLMYKLYDAAKAKGVEELLIKSRTLTGMTPLMIAARGKTSSFEQAEEEMKGTVHADKTIEDGIFSDAYIQNVVHVMNIHMENLRASAACAHFLLQAGADISAQDINGDTPLHHAARAGNVYRDQNGILQGALPVLLSHPTVDFFKTNKEGETPFYTALHERNCLALHVIGKAMKQGRQNIVQQAYTLLKNAERTRE